jgi:DedD protein
LNGSTLACGLCSKNFAANPMVKKNLGSTPVFPGRPLGYTRAEMESGLFQSMTDRALKERIVGAVVLVVFAVLVVPIFLDGAADEQEIVSESVTLPGQNSQDRRKQTIVLNRDRNEPVPAAELPAPADDRPEDPRQQQVAAGGSAEDNPDPAPATSGQPVASPPATTSTTGMWAVQLGSFKNKENADRLAASLRSQGYLAFISQQQTGPAMHRVRVGPQKDRQSAAAIAAQLAKSGHEGQVVPHP